MNKTLRLKVLAVALLIQLNVFAQHEYLGETPPVDSTPLLFGAGKISTSFNERDFTISPDGTEIYYSLQYSFTSSVIVYLKSENGKWGHVRRAPFSSLETIDIEPAFSPDGQRLFFASRRNGTFDIFYVERQSDGNWSSPIDAGSAVNTGANEFYPSVTSDGTLYYTAPYNGSEDIWASSVVGGNYTAPVALPSPVNTSQGEFNAYVTPNGQTIYFGSERTGGGDIYKSTKSGSTWSSPVRISQNGGSLDYCPSLSPDGEYFFFTSERSVDPLIAPNPFDVERVIRSQNLPRGSGGNIYWSK